MGVRVDYTAVWVFRLIVGKVFYNVKQIYANVNTERMHAQLQVGEILH